jgi:photosystem II stability/assembly factor-like uncharacterized protein
MKKPIYLFFILVLFQINSYSQFNWIKQCPSPNTGYNLISLDFKDYNTGILSCVNGIFKTTDGSASWTNIQPGWYPGFVSYNNYNKWFLSGGFVKYSTNDGLNWIQTQGVVDHNITFVNANYGSGLYGSGISKTTDGGLNWTIFPSNINQFFASDQQMINENTIFIVGAYGQMAKTTDGGLNWTQIAGSTSNDDFTHVKFIDEHTGYAHTIYYAKLFKTTNGGYNWLNVFTTPATVSHFDFINAKTGVVVADEGRVYTTTNGGTNWSFKFIDSAFAFRYVKMLNKDTLIASAYLERGGPDYSFHWFRSTDFGNTFTYLNNASRSTHYGMHFLNKSFGYTVGNNGKTLKTTNGGTNWVPVIIQNNYESSQFNSVFSVNPNVTYIVCTQGKIYKTTNGGHNWIRQVSGTTNELCNVYFTDINTGYVAGKSGTILKTTNGGDNWTQLNTGVIENFFSVSMLNSLQGFAVGDYGRILKTTNGGTSWVLKNSSSAYWLTSINFINQNTGMAAGGNGTILKTTNGGENWTQLNTGISLQLFGISMFNNNLAAACGMNGTVLVSSNGGNNWITNNTDTSVQLRAIQFVDSANVYVCGELGLIYKKSFSNLVNVNILSSILPVKYILHQNYPNPFNPATKIRFDVVHSGDIKIVVYDITGKELKTLVNDKLQPGTYETTFDGSGLNSGVYFYKMTADGFTVVKKMVLLK